VFSKSLSSFTRYLSNSGNDTKQRVAMVCDWFFAFCALGFTHLLRLVEIDFIQFWPLFVILPVLTVIFFSVFGVYSMVVRFSGLEEMAPLIKGVVFSSLALLVLLFLFRFDPNPRSLFVIYGLVLLVFCAAARHLWKVKAIGHSMDVGVPTAIYGAGVLGRQVMRICRDGSDYRPVVWLDDDEKYHGRSLAQALILDPKADDTPARLQELGVETILMAAPSISSQHMKGVLQSLQRFNCTVRTLPSINDIMANKVTSKDIKQFPFEAMIGRSPVEPDMKLMRKNIDGRVVMVTGAGGSVGSELCRQIFPLRPAALILFDVSEAATYKIKSDLDTLSAESKGEIPRVHCVLGNVVFKGEIAHAIQSYSVQTLFHAAAYKHVPLVESNPQPAVRTNIFGSLATLEAAIENNVENFLLISTDKAVRPTNVMGATKRVAEMVVQAKAAAGASNTKVCMVRFGNVIGSSGSVVPKFSRQIESGGPVTVTHKDIVRYFMSIPEAAQLVIQASALCEGGDLFLLDMGQPVQIADLAKSLIYLKGKTLKDEENPRGEIEIQYTGLREGEKLYEELLIDETVEGTVHPKIARAKEGFVEWSELSPILDRFMSVMQNDPDNEMVEQLKSVVTGYQPNRFVAVKETEKPLESKQLSEPEPIDQ